MLFFLVAAFVFRNILFQSYANDDHAENDYALVDKYELDALNSNSILDA